MTIRLRFVNRLHEADHVASFLFEPESLLDYQAGQYLQCQLPHPDADARGVSRSFTIASAPGEPFLRLTTRLSTKPSTFKQALAGLRPGGVLEASGPFGQFVYTETDTPAVMIAGGIGITPFRAMLADLADRKVRASTTLLYSNSSADIPFQPFFDGLVRDWPWLHVVYTVTQPDADWRGPTGRIDAAFIRRHVNDRTRPLYFVCGPSPLVEAMRATLAAMGVDPSRIKHEGFPGYEAAHATESGDPVAMVH